jgi:Tfp pilus assembly PilM family ATPase
MATDSRGYAAGLVIGQETITMVEIRAQRGRAEITSRGIAETPRGAVDGAAVVDPVRVGQAIRSLRREMNMQSRSVTVALRTPGYNMRSARLPDVPAREQRTLVRNELEESGALPVSGGALDFLWLPTPSSDGKRQAEAIAYYVDDVTVDNVLNTLRQAGVNDDGIEPASLLMMRAALAGLQDPKPVALLAVSERHSDMCIHDGHIVRHVRRIPSGWGELARPDQPISALGLGPAMEPETRATGIGSTETGAPRAGWEAGEGSGEARTPETLPAAHASESLHGLAAPNGAARVRTTSFLASEISRSLAFFARDYASAGQPEALIVLAPSHVVGSIREILSASIPIAVPTEDPLDAFALPPPQGTASATEEMSDTLAALGAALSDTDTIIPKVDISQQEVSAKARRRAPSVLLAGMAGSTIWMLLALAATIALTFMEGRANSRSGQLEQEIKTVKEQQAPLLRYQEIFNSAKAAAQKSGLPADAVLGRVAASTTPGVAVTSIKITPDGKVTVEGEALDTRSMQTFALSLNLGRAIRTPTFESFKKDDKVGITFRIVGTHKAVEAAK